MKKIEYVRCPRCELNFIDKKEKLCKVCQAELKAKGTQTMSDEEALEMGLCPVCKTNYITDEEDMCAECARERDLQNDRIDGLGDDDEETDIGEENWRKYIENDDIETEDDEFGDMTSIADADDLDDEDSMDFKDDEMDEIDDMDDFDDFEDLDDLDDDFDEDDEEYCDEDDDE